MKKITMILLVMFITLIWINQSFWYEWANEKLAKAFDNKIYEFMNKKTNWQFPRTYVRWFCDSIEDIWKRIKSDSRNDFKEFYCDIEFLEYNMIKKEVLERENSYDSIKTSVDLKKLQYSLIRDISKTSYDFKDLEKDLKNKLKYINKAWITKNEVRTMKLIELMFYI